VRRGRAGAGGDSGRGPGVREGPARRNRRLARPARGAGRTAGGLRRLGARARGDRPHAQRQAPPRPRPPALAPTVRRRDLLAPALPVPLAGRRSLTDDCVHCGFCLPVCPTWNSWSEEMDSPRGRIDLMRGLSEGKLEWTDSVAKHFDRCLGCLACVTACPSGVRYDVLIEQTRARREEAASRGGLDPLFRQAVLAVLPYPDRLRLVASLATVYRRLGLARLVRASGLLGRVSPRLAALEALMPEGGAGDEGPLPRRLAPRGARRARVALVTGCVQSAF